MNEAETEEKVEAIPASDAPPKPQVRPFAVMKLTHDGIRGCLDDMSAAAQNVSDECTSENIEVLQSIFNDLSRCIDIHTKQEENVFFPFMNEQFDDIMTKEGISGEHDDDISSRQSLGEMLEKIKAEPDSDSAQMVLEALEDFKKDHLTHLKVFDFSLLSTRNDSFRPLLICVRLCVHYYYSTKRK